MIIHSESAYGRSSVNRLSKAQDHGIDDARALLETFNYAFNQRVGGGFLIVT